MENKSVRFSIFAKNYYENISVFRQIFSINSGFKIGKNLNWTSEIIKLIGSIRYPNDCGQFWLHFGLVISEEMIFANVNGRRTKGDDDDDDGRQVLEKSSNGLSD